MRPNEVLRGRGIGNTTADVLPHPLGLQRNGTLPPIALEADNTYGKVGAKISDSQRVLEILHKLHYSESLIINVVLAGKQSPEK